MFSFQENVSLQTHNTFGIHAKASQWVKLDSVEDARAILTDFGLKHTPKFILGGGSNLVLTGDVEGLVLKAAILGKRVVTHTPTHFVVEAGAGENWHEFVRWTLEQHMPGLENLALIPGSVGAAPVQNIGAYGLELQDRFDSLDYLDLTTGAKHSLNADACRFGYRDSIFKRELQGQALITHVRFALPKSWKPNISYAELAKFAKQEAQSDAPTPSMIFEWVCQIRRAKLPDPAVDGNVGSFFKNPTVNHNQCQALIQSNPNLVHYRLPNGSSKLAAAWLIERCGWKGRSMGNVGVHPHHALVLINRQRETGVCASGQEVVTLAQAIQVSVYDRFGIHLEIEPLLL